MQPEAGVDGQGVDPRDQERGLAVPCRTVDDDDLMHALLDSGVDVLTSNRITTLRGVPDARA